MVERLRGFGPGRWLGRFVSSPLGTAASGGRILTEASVSLHEQLTQWTARGGPNASSARRWRGLAARRAPRDLSARVRVGAGALAAGLIGFGVVMWVAANWDELGRAARFGLLQALLATTLLGAAARPAWRAALTLLSFLALGGLLAFFGQTYQTGADTWQLFALWAALGLPLALGARSDLLWTPWAVVVATAISLWMHTFAGRAWTVTAASLPVHLVGFALAGLLCGALSLRAIAAPCAWRVAVLAGVMVVSGTALGGLFARETAPQFLLGVLVLAAALAVAWWRREIFAMSLLALAVDTLLVLGVFRWRLVERGDTLATFAFGSLAAMLLLSASASLILRRARPGAAR